MMDTAFYYFLHLLIKFFLILQAVLEPRELLRRIKATILTTKNLVSGRTTEGDFKSSVSVKPKNLAIVFVDEKLINFVELHFGFDSPFFK